MNFGTSVAIESIHSTTAIHPYPHPYTTKILGEALLFRYLEEIKYLQQQLIYLQTELLEIKRELDKKIKILEERTTSTEEEEIKFRKIPEEEAKELVKKYISENPGCLTSEIIEELQLDPLLVAKVLKQLEEGVIEKCEPE